MIEEILKDLYTSNNRWNIALLRYFNPVGAHSIGRSGEDPNSTPNNVMPLIVQVAVGRGYSVLELISTFEEISGKKIKYTIGERRSGDIAACYADLAMANRALGCKTYFDINDMCANIWRWQSLNPNGYE